MKQLTVTEHTRIERCKLGQLARYKDSKCLEECLYDRLKLFDYKQRQKSEKVFEWNDGFVRTTQWVGVIQVPGLQLEILPKTDVLIYSKLEETSEAEYQARRNLLYMLSVGGNVPITSRDLARLTTKQASISETLTLIFANRLRQELLKGLERSYIQKEENIQQFKGKLLVSKQGLYNSAHREKFYCRYDEFLDDTLMNKIFHACCRILIKVTISKNTQDILRQCLQILGNVTAVEIQDTDFKRITLNRQNERFEDLLQFCRLVLAKHTPLIETGQTHTFSLLFDMNKVFEKFVVGFICRYVAPYIENIKIFPQARQQKRHLMENNGKGILRLEPDLLIENNTSRLVMDTKWKVLVPKKSANKGVTNMDLYQLYAYTRRYGSNTGILLYPYTRELEPSNFRIINDKNEFSGEQIAIRYLQLHRNLYQENEQLSLAKELNCIIREGLQLTR